MTSPADAIWAYGNLSNSQLVSSPNSEVEYYMRNVAVTTITTTGTYIITIKNWSALATLYANFNSDPAATNQHYVDVAQANGFSAEYALLNIYGSAINLYKAPVGSTTFTPIKLIITAM